MLAMVSGCLARLPPLRKQRLPLLGAPAPLRVLQLHGPE
jgi:hypothetical protein